MCEVPTHTGAERRGDCNLACVTYHRTPQCHAKFWCTVAMRASGVEAARSETVLVTAGSFLREGSGSSQETLVAHMGVERTGRGARLLRGWVGSDLLHPGGGLK